MTRKTKKSEDGQSISEMVEGLSREAARRMYKDGKPTAHGREMAKILDRAKRPSWNLSGLMVLAQPPGVPHLA